MPWPKPEVITVARPQSRGHSGAAALVQLDRRRLVEAERAERGLHPLRRPSASAIWAVAMLERMDHQLGDVERAGRADGRR